MLDMNHVPDPAEGARGTRRGSRKVRGRWYRKGMVWMEFALYFSND